MSPFFLLPCHLQEESIENHGEVLVPPRQLLFIVDKKNTGKMPHMTFERLTICRKVFRDVYMMHTFLSFAAAFRMSAIVKFLMSQLTLRLTCYTFPW